MKVSSSVKSNVYIVRRSSSINSNASTISTSTIEENLENSVQEIAENILTEATSSYNFNNGNVSRTTPEENGLTEQERIIQVMDRDIAPSSSNQLNAFENALRNRRLMNETAPNDNLINNITENETILSPTSDDINQTSQIKDEDKISIKLKYLNDEVKIVECFLNESVGNFKKLVSEFFN